MGACGAGAVSLALGLLVLGPAAAFNLDTEHFTRHGAPGQRPAMFGFAVAAHRERGQPWVMVGAPEAQTGQPGVERGGAVFRCDPSRDDACAEVPFDRNGNMNDNSTGGQMDQKSWQWFGATISSAGEDGPIVACAPRYVSYAAKNSRRDPVGTCYVTRNGFSEVIEYAPCRTRNWGYHRQGSCQAGLGASISRDGRRLFIGAPGSWYWQGQMYSINPTIRLPFMPPRYKEYGEGQLYSQSLDVKPSVLSTPENKPSDDDSYLGYSVAVGDFSGGGEQGVAVGMPRGAELLGKVVLYSWDLQNISNLTGEQIGAYFGYCLCAADVDGDGLEDLIVGAPMYTPINNEGKYDVGRIYVIYQNSEEGKFVRVDSRDGAMSKSRFGLSLAALGDINFDGFGDFAVGAPYDGVNGRGAVYIFHGGADGIHEKASQVIKAEDTAQGSLSTFGFSLAGNVDLDANQYNDLVIGAYEADTAFLFRAKPVVKMQASILFGTASKLISLNEKNCTLYSRRKVTCTTINYCFKYDGIGVDTAVDFDLQFILDAKKPNDPRLYFRDHEGRHILNQTIPLTRDVMYCNSMPVYIVPNVRDKLTPIEAEVRYTMREERSTIGGAKRRNPRSILRPILDQNVPNVQKDYINIQKNCGSDNVCIPDLRLMATPSVNRYLLGSKERLNITVMVQNLGEDAFEASYDLQLPVGLNYIKIERIDDAVAEIPVQCSPPTSFNNNTLKCDIGNPLPQGRFVHFKVLLEPFHKTGSPPFYNLFMTANSTNPEKNDSIGNNQQSMFIEIWVDSDISIVGASNHADVHYNTSLYQEVNKTHEADIGPSVEYTFHVTNNGPSIIEEAEVFILWPYETLAGDSLIYVLEQPSTTGNIQCETADHINDFHLQIDRKKKFSAVHGGLTGSSASNSGSVSSVSGGAAGATTGSSSSWSSSSSRNVSSGSKVLTEEQKKKIEEEEKKFSKETGDGSQVHVQRAQQAHATGVTTQGGHWNSEAHWDGSRNVGKPGHGGQVVTWNKTYVTSDGQQWNPAIDGNRWSTTQTWSTNAQPAQPGSWVTSPDGKRVWVVSGGQQGGTWETNADGKRVWVMSGGQQGGSWVTNTDGKQVWVVNGGQQGGTWETNADGKRVWVVSGGQQGGSWVSNADGKQVWAASGGQQGGSWVTREGKRVWMSNNSGSDGSWVTDADGKYVWISGSSVGSRPETGSWVNSADGKRVWVVGNSGAAGGQQEGTWITNTDGKRIWVVGNSASGGEQIRGSWVTNADGKRVWVIGHEGGSWVMGPDGKPMWEGGNQGTQYTWRETASPINKTYTTSWNSTWTGTGPAVITHTIRNVTSSVGADGTVHERESSTEYYTLGAEGEIGSSFNNRIDSSDRTHDIHSTYSHRGGGGGGQMGQDDFGQGGSTRYGAGSYTSGSARRYNTGDRKYSSGYNVPASQNWGDSQGEGGENYASSGARHKWSTEETVNKDLINAGSATFHREAASNTYVGAPQKPVGLGAAAAGKGFRVGAVDLDSLDTQKSQQQSATWGGQQGQQGGGAQSYSSSYHTQWSSLDNGDQARDSMVTGRPQEHFRWDRRARSRRESGEDEDGEGEMISRKKRQLLIDRNEEALRNATQCNGLRCATMRCVTGPISNNHEIRIVLRARINAQTLIKLSGDRPMNVTSLGVARVSRLPYVGVPVERQLKSAEVVSTCIPLSPLQPPDPIPLWAVVLAACAGAILLLLLVYLLYKCGFFKRNRPSDAPERQPLNRNGYGHGDEQL